MAVDNKKTGTGFTNLSRVLQANQGNRLGSTIASNIQGQAQKAKGQIESGVQDFKTEAEKNRLDTEANKQFVGGTIQNIQNKQDFTTGDISSGDKERFAKIRQGIYQGPQQIQNIQNVRGAAQQAQQLGNLTTSGAGRQELLKQTVGSPNYSYGQRKIDSMLLAQQPNQLSNVRRTTQGLVQQADLADAQSRAYAQELQGRAKEFGQQAQEQLGGAMTRIEGQVKSQLQADQEAETQRQENLKQIAYLSSGYRNRQQDGKDMIDPNTGLVIRDKITDLNPLQRAESIQKLLQNSNVDENAIKQLFGQNVYDIDNAKKQATEALARSYASVHGASSPNYWDTYWANQNIGDVLSNPTRFNYYQSISPSFQQYKDLQSSKLGQSYNEGSMDEFLKRVGESIQSRSASTEGRPENLTEQGVATEQQRARFQALNELLGKQASDAKYRTDADRYRPGRILINPDQI